MKKAIIVILFAAAFGACKNGSGESTGTGDSTGAFTTPTTGNSNSTNQQVIPMDSLEHSSDSTGNIHPADTTKNK